MNLLVLLSGRWTPTSGVSRSPSMSSDGYITLGILILLLLAAVFFGLYLKDQDEKPDDPKWWEGREWGDEPIWPGGGAIPPKREEEKELTDAKSKNPVHS